MVQRKPAGYGRRRLQSSRATTSTMRRAASRQATRKTWSGSADAAAVEKVGDRLRQRLGVIDPKIERAGPSDLAKDRDVAADDRAAAARRLDDRQAEPFGIGREDQRRRMVVEKRKLVVVRVVEPEQPTAEFLMFENFACHRFFKPAAPADEDDPDIAATRPEFFKGAKRDALTFARFDRADGEKDRRIARRPPL